ncbi:MAG TPA: type III pantothenate kinase [Terriglobales bacterium]|nr:type III pantothenate kinase [Terriglobales bacterium]
MLLALDIGNSNIVAGLFRGETLEASWRLTTSRSQTVDEFSLLLGGLFSAGGFETKQVRGAIVASVVPPLDSMVRGALRRMFGHEALFVSPGLKTGMPIHYDSPADVGADRIVNAVAGFAAYGGPLIIVDFGTATTFDVVNAQGEYAGGIICPGIAISADALFSRAARLQRVEIRPPARLIGTTTVGSIQSGLFYGYLSLVDGLIERLRAEIGADAKAIATGGLASLMAGESRTISACDEQLTLTGLRLLWQRNVARGRQPG